MKHRPPRDNRYNEALRGEQQKRSSLVRLKKSREMPSCPEKSPHSPTGICAERTKTEIRQNYHPKSNGTSEEERT